MITRLRKPDLSRQMFFVFLRDFLKDPIRVGAISESSSAMANAMLQNLVIGPEDAVMELGPGTGVFTQQIREKTNIYLGIERSLRFTRLLDERFPDLRFVNGLAEDGFHYQQELGLPLPKAIICGLPLAIWPPELQDGIINSLRDLMTPGCVFRTFQYVHSFVFPLALRFRRRMDMLYGRGERSRIVLRNLPPAFVVTWRHR